MEMKRCLFCDKVVPVQPQGEYDRFIGCCCAPESSYRLLRDSYNDYFTLDFQMRRHMFPIISAYIRDLTENEETVSLSIDDLETIRHSPRIPVSFEDKASLLLRYFHKRASGPDVPVIIPRLSDHYNLTYSPNLQELVYVIEKLREDQLIDRTGSAFRLTDKGWKEAVARAGGRKLKPCTVLLPADAELRDEWSAKVLPALERCGYAPRLIERTAVDKLHDPAFVDAVSECKLLVADVSAASPEAYFASGLALGKDIPVVWAVKRSAADDQPLRLQRIRPFLWDDAEELADMLQQRLK